MSIMLAAASLISILACFVAACWCRVRWAALPPRAKPALIFSAALLTGTYALAVRAGWAFAAPWANVLLGAAAVGSYTLLALPLSLLRPKMLTRAMAGLLLIPVLAAFVLLPLSAGYAGISESNVAGDLYFAKCRWDAGAFGSSGIKLALYRKPRLAPFLIHNIGAVVFDDAKCDTERAYMVLDPDGRHILARCPWPAYSHRPGFHEYRVPVY
jgi:hypothetical protein